MPLVFTLNNNREERMVRLENEYRILRLTEDFYNDYPNPPYIEILKKRQRAYNCLIFPTQSKCFICIPYRTEINHSYAYHFTSSVRSRAHRSGLDYTKIVIITQNKYLDSLPAIIDQDEFLETIRNIDRIKITAIQFVEDYINHIKGMKTLHYREFSRRYQYSPLKYFHSELGI